MGLPGFSAGSSLYKTRNSYRATVAGEMLIASNQADATRAVALLHVEPASFSNLQLPWSDTDAGIVKYDSTTPFANLEIGGASPICCLASPESLQHTYL